MAGCRAERRRRRPHGARVDPRRAAGGRRPSTKGAGRATPTASRGTFERSRVCRRRAGRGAAGAIGSNRGPTRVAQSGHRLAAARIGRPPWGLPTAGAKFVGLGEALPPAAPFPAMEVPSASPVIQRADDDGLLGGIRRRVSDAVDAVRSGWGRLTEVAGGAMGALRDGLGAAVGGLQSATSAAIGGDRDRVDRGVGPRDGAPSQRRGSACGAAVRGDGALAPRGGRRPQPRRRLLGARHGPR